MLTNLRKPLATLRRAGLAVALSACAGGAYALPTFPAPNCGVGAGFNCLTFGDFSVYSLALLNFAATGLVANPGPGDPFYVKSSPGELGRDGYIVYGTGTNNNGVVTNVAGVDNAYFTPEGSVGSFSTSLSEPIPNGFTGDQANRWSAQIAAMRTELGAQPGDQFMIYFNLNETGNDNLSGIDLLIWARATLVDGAGNTLSFTLCGDPMIGGCQGLAAPDQTKLWTTGNYQSPIGAPGGLPGPVQTPNNQPGDPNDEQWTYVHGTICARQAAPGVPQFLHFGPCVAGDPADAKNLDQNLGANAAAFAIYNQTIANAITDPNSPWLYLQVDWRMSQQNNGYEQAFSAVNRMQQEIPEPGTLALLGIAVVGIGWTTRRRVTKA